MTCNASDYVADNASTPSQSYSQSVGDVIVPDDCNNEILCWIRNHPVAAIGIALAVGLLLGRR